MQKLTFQASATALYDSPNHPGQRQNALGSEAFSNFMAKPGTLAPQLQPIEKRVGDYIKHSLMSSGFPTPR